MATKETSALNPATAFTGTETIVLVQGGNSRRGTLNMIRDFLSSFTSRTLAKSPKAAVMVSEVLEEDITLTGASVDSTMVIPNRAICLAVSSRTITAVAGSASYSVGVAGETGKFGSALGAAVGSTNIGVIGPTAVYADTKIRISAATMASFTGGKVRLSLFILKFSVPEA